MQKYSIIRTFVKQELQKYCYFLLHLQQIVQKMRGDRLNLPERTK